MVERVTPMLYVPDVVRTADWYASIGFNVRDRAFDGSEVVWASLTFGSSEVMLSIGGRPSDAYRREVDLYIHVDDVEAMFGRLDGKVEIVEGLHDTFYGMREFIIRDCN